jgi:murein DD-endopeptidase MepM/ murein hydrolase activator NlpD
MKEKTRFIVISGDQKQYKEFRFSRIQIISFTLIALLTISTIAKFGADFLLEYSRNSEISKLRRTNKVLQERLVEMDGKVSKLTSQINLIAKQDDELRTIMGIEKLNSDVRNVGIGGARYNYDLIDNVSGFDDNAKLNKQLTEIAKLEREVSLYKQSYHSLLVTFDKKQDSIAYLPSIRPILRGTISSPFGMRMHPLYHTMRYHEGLDISAPTGTPIYATANGTVEFAGKMHGYGNLVTIDHKYGYSTRYGHMSKILVRKGQRVKKGEKIGEVGNTGVSTAPHVHYEVRYHGQPQNPSGYYFDDIILNEQVVAKAN